MKKIITFFLVMLIGFVSCDTVTHYTIRVSVDRHPTLTIENQTGHQVVVTAPIASSINNGARTQFQPVETNQSIDVTYRIGQITFTEQAIMRDQDTAITLTRRPPTITVVNQTGHSVSVTTPVSSSMSNGASTDFLAPRLNQSIDITYVIGQMSLTEQVNMRDQDVTVTLTRRPPTLTIVNNVGATINTIFLRTPGAPSWIGGNIVIRDGRVRLNLTETAQAGEIGGSIVNRDNMQISMEDLPISGDRFDIRIDDVNSISYVRSNVQIRGDMTVTFTAADRR